MKLQKALNTLRSSTLSGRGQEHMHSEDMRQDKNPDNPWGFSEPMLRNSSSNSGSKWCVNNF